MNDSLEADGPYIQEVCGGLKENGPLREWHIGGVALLEESCHCRGGLSGLFCSSFPQHDCQLTSCCL